MKREDFNKKLKTFGRGKIYFIKLHPSRERYPDSFQNYFLFTYRSGYRLVRGHFLSYHGFEFPWQIQNYKDIKFIVEVDIEYILRQDTWEKKTAIANLSKPKLLTHQNQFLRKTAKETQARLKELKGIKND